MTKAELIAKLAHLPDDAQVLVMAWPSDTNEHGPSPDDLYAIQDADTTCADGPDAPPFGTIRANVEFVEYIPSA